MTLIELIEELQGALEDLGPDAEVRIAYQPDYPLRTALRRVTVPISTDQSDLYGEDEQASGQDKDGTFVWLASAETPDSESPYAPRWAWQQDADRW